MKEKICFCNPIYKYKFLRFSAKQHIKCQLAITRILIITLGCSYLFVLVVKRLFKFVKVKLKNALTKSSKIKAKVKPIKIFIPKPKVQFIRID